LQAAFIVGRFYCQQVAVLSAPPCIVAVRAPWDVTVNEAQAVSLTCTLPGAGTMVNEKVAGVEGTPGANDNIGAVTVTLLT
jgi:hypothetical protein